MVEKRAFRINAQATFHGVEKRAFRINAQATFHVPWAEAHVRQSLESMPIVSIQRKVSMVKATEGWCQSG
jgi:hypothetical protein